MYKIKNKQLEVNVKSFGAELNSIKKNDSDYEYLWQGNPDYWKRQAPILFPIVGRLLEDTYEYEKITYNMTQHGFARDSEFTCVESSNTKLLFKLSYSHESLLKYPFKFELYLGYELIEDLIKVSYKVINIDKKTMPFSIGAHPAFNWDKSIEASFKYPDQSVSSYLVTSNGITDGPIVKLENVVLSESVFKNDALVYAGLHNTTFTNGSKGIEMAFDGFSYVGLWSKPSGAPFVCIEPWYGIGDTVDHNKQIMDKEGIITLDPNKVFEAFYTIKPL